MEKRAERYKIIADSVQSTPATHEVELPEMEVDELKKALKLADKYTMQSIVDYIKADIYHLVKNTAKTINKQNFADVAIYMDGAINRLESILKILKESIQSQTFVNRIKGKEEQVHRNRNSD